MTAPTRRRLCPEPTPPPAPELLDLRAVTRPGMWCEVSLTDPDSYERSRWLRLGVPEIAHAREGIYFLGARLSRGATDPSEDSAWAIRLALTGVRFEFMASEATYVEGWIAAGGREFHVPRAGVDPFAGSVPCTSVGCTPKGHPIVERYVPEVYAELYERIVGWKVSIVYGPGKARE